MHLYSSVVFKSASMYSLSFEPKVSFVWLSRLNRLISRQYCFNDFKISEEEFISLDSLLKESAMKEGFFIDDSIYQDVIGAFPFSLTFVVRK